MYKTHTYKDPDQQPTLYEELEENEVFTPGYDEGVYKQITPYRMTDDDEQAEFENRDSGVNISESDNVPDNDKKEIPAHGDRDSEGNIYQRDVGGYVSEEMFAYLNELVYSKEDDEHKKRRVFSINKLEGEGGIIEAGYPFLTTEGGAEPTKFRAKHTYLPVNINEFFAAADGIGAGVKSAKLRLPLAKAISRFTGAINEATEKRTEKNMKKSTNDKMRTKCYIERKKLSDPSWIEKKKWDIDQDTLISYEVYQIIKGDTIEHIKHK